MFRHVRVAEIFQLKVTKFYFHFRNVRSIFRSFSFVMHSIQWMEESENSTDQIKIRLLLPCELCIQLTQWKIQQHSDKSRKKYNVDFVLDCSPVGRWFHCEYFRFYLRHRFTWIENGVFNYTAVKIAKQLTKIFISGWIVIIIVIIHEKHSRMIYIEYVQVHVFTDDHDETWNMPVSTTSTRIWTKIHSKECRSATTGTPVMRTQPCAEKTYLYLNEFSQKNIGQCVNIY